ncbi:MAG TPA: 16S rRNA (adenine(1518)-N(6)/adenine(1519)-N(6))-dimethyltransferase RsmA [Myxococcota bacterium]|nr:16S rRNA (adenine(1518)-N(6)/adenine(1519)-N(6))-dimethyltransferase RsmA [Myxococcota bacterium]
MASTPVRELLARHGLAPSRDRGQNFLIDERVAAELVERAGVLPDDSVIEVGTGLGILTRALAARAQRVLTIEVDAGLVRALRADALLPDRVELRHADALALDWPALVRERAATRVVANLPYAISAPLLRALLDLRGLLRDWSVMIQRDVADRLLAEPGSRAYSSLSVLYRLCAALRRERDLAPGLFFPVPNVRSSFVRATPHARARIGAGELAWVEEVVRAAFGQRRKTLANALRGAGFPDPIEACTAVGIDPRARAESLAPEAFLALSRALAPAVVQRP